MQIPDYHDWMGQTELKWKPRGLKLRALDNAILMYNAVPKESAKIEIRKALNAWIRSENYEWQNNERNRAPYYPITKLREAVRDENALTQNERNAWAAVEQARRTAIQTDFQNARIRLRLVDTFLQLRIAFRELKSTLGNLGSATKAAIRPEIMTAVNDLFGTEVQDAAQFGAQLVADFGVQPAIEVVSEVTSFLPIVSLVKDGLETLVRSASLAKSVYTRIAAERHNSALERSDPRAAFDAVKSLLTRELVFDGLKTAITAAAAGAHGGLMAAKGADVVFAPVVGAVKSGAKAICTLVQFAIEYRETRKARKLLRHPEKLNLRAFQVCPLLGAYFLITAQTDQLVAMLSSEFGQDGWMDEYQALIKSHIHPVQDLASDVIQNSQFVVVGVPLHRSTGGCTRDRKLAAAYA